MVQRQELLERLLAAHEGYFDVEDTFELAGQTFQGRAQFHSESMQYVLSKKAKIWARTSMSMSCSAHLSILI